MPRHTPLVATPDWERGNDADRQEEADRKTTALTTACADRQGTVGSENQERL